MGNIYKTKEKDSELKVQGRDKEEMNRITKNKMKLEIKVI